MTSNLDAYFQSNAAQPEGSGVLHSLSITSESNLGETSDKGTHWVMSYDAQSHAVGRYKTGADVHPGALKHPSHPSANPTISTQATRKDISAKLEEDTASENDNSAQPSESLAFTDDEKFGLLSAYLDDEVSEEERCLIDHWLKSDEQMKQTYQQQIKLRSAFKLLANDFDWE